MYQTQDGNNTTFHFNSIAEMVDHVERDSMTRQSIGTAGHSGERRGKDHSFYGPSSYVQVCQNLVKGSEDRELLAKADEMLEQLEYEEVETYGRVYSRDVFGSRLSVGEYAVGSPTCFRRRRAVENEAMPVRIYFCLDAAAGVTAKGFLDRGLAILALVRRLEMERPVELVAFSTGKLGRNELKGIIDLIPVNTKPLDLATFLPFVTDVNVTRRLLQGHFDGYGYVGDSITYDVPATKKLLGLDDNDICIGRTNYDSEWSNPVRWVNKQLKMVKTRSEE